MFKGTMGRSGRSGVGFDPVEREYQEDHKKVFDFSSRGDRKLNHNIRLIILILGIVAIIVVAGYVFNSISMAIGTTVVAGLVVFILRRPVNWLERKGMHRGLAALIMILVAMIIITALIVSFIPLTIQQATDFINQIPSYVATFQQWLQNLTTSGSNQVTDEAVQMWLSQFVTSITNASSSAQSSIISTIANSAMSIATLLVLGFTAFIVAFWILLDYDKFTREIHALESPTVKYYMILFTTILSRVLSGFLKGTLIGALIVAIVTGVGYWIIGLPFPMVLGILSGLLSIIPYLGPIVSSIVIAILALFISPLAAIFAVIITAVVPWVVGTVVSPKVMSETVNLHPGITLVVIIAGGALGGPVGMIAAIPVTAFVKGVLVYLFESRTGRQIVSTDGALFEGKPTETVDAVADATAGFLTHESLLARVDELESEVKKKGSGASSSSAVGADATSTASEAAESPTSDKME